MMTERILSSSDLETAATSDVCQPKLYSSIPTTAKVEPRKEVREIGKDAMMIEKECAECRKKIKKVKKGFVCKCKKVLHCSYDCQQASQHQCQGRTPWRLSFKEFQSRLEERRENKDAKDDMVKEGMEKYKSLEDMERLAKSGDPFTAYMIGVSYSQRIACSAGGDSKKSPVPIYMPEKYLEKSTTETDEIAMKWFQIAAEGGIANGMISLAHKIYSSNGLKTDSRFGFYWLAKAIESGAELEPETMELLESKAMLINDISAVDESIKMQLQAPEIRHLFQGSGKQVPLVGPNLGALLLATRYREIEKWGGKTYNGGIFYGFRKFSNLVRQINSCKLVPQFVAGRGGSASGVTRLCVPAERLVSNTKFRQGVRGTTDNGGLLDVEQVTKASKDAWYTTERSKYLMTCVHHGQFNFTPVGECSKCLAEAVKRTTGVAEGLYSISITETVPGYGYGARYYTVAEGNMVLETFKAYSQPEIGCVLQCLMSNPADLHPLHLAEDPNLYWPIIWFYGSVYTALLQSCGSKVVKKIYGKLSKYRSNKISSGRPAIPTSLSAFPSFAIGEMRIACGNEVCPNLDHSEKFLKCTGCRVRYYCSEQCQRSDWKKHKAECKWGKN